MLADIAPYLVAVPFTVGIVFLCLASLRGTADEYPIVGDGAWINPEDKK
jgi:hypothetical protein